MKIISLLATAAVIQLPIAAHAADDASTPGAEETQRETGISDIIVTARRSSESMQSIPVAVSALSDVALERQQVTGIQSLQYQVPSLQVAADGSSGGLILGMRGMSNSVTTTSVDQAIGLYLDNIYYARAQAFSMDLEDVERVEVLRGPQGTLFGRNATGGAINITTKRPVGEFEGWARLSVGNYDTYSGTGVINVPLEGDQLALRVLASHNERGGYGKSLTTGRKIANLNQESYRGKLLIAPDEQIWKLELTGSYVDRRDNGPILHLLAYNPARIPAVLRPSFDAAIAAPFYRNLSASKSFMHVRTWSSSANLEVDLGGVTLKSISGLNGYRFSGSNDYDAGTSPYLDMVNKSHQQQFSEELQLTGESDRLKWIVGAFFFRESSLQRYVLFNGLVDQPIRSVHRSYAIFGQATYALTDSLNLTGGLRWTRDTRREQTNFLYAGACSTPGTTAPDCGAVGKAKFAYPSYTVSLDYQVTPTTLAYIRTSSSRRAGGLNVYTPNFPAYDPEKVTDYEIGIKADLFNRRLRVNGAFYYTDFRNFQRSIVSTTGIGVLTQSVGKARVLGGEVEVTARPTTNLELSANMAIVKPKYLEFFDATGDLRGQPFLYTPERTFNVGATYTIPTSAGDVAVHADYGYRSKIWFAPPLNGVQLFSREAGYGLLNGKISMQLDAVPVELAIFGRNLLEKKYNSNRTDLYGPLGLGVAIRGEPRTWGGSMTYRF